MAANFDKILKTAVSKIFDTIDSVTTLVTYVRSVPGAYNAATDVVTKTDTQYPNIKALRTKIVEDDADWLISNTKMQKLYIPYNALPFTATDDDYVLIGGIKWNVHKIREVPGESVHILYVREP